MIVGIPRETVPGERRVALVPDLVPKLARAGRGDVVRSEGGAAGVPDPSYTEKVARVEPDVLDRADVVLKVQPPTPDEAGRLKEGATLIGLLGPYASVEPIKALAGRKVTAFSLELMPRITRAQ